MAFVKQASIGLSWVARGKFGFGLILIVGYSFNKPNLNRELEEKRTRCFGNTGQLLDIIRKYFRVITRSTSALMMRHQCMIWLTPWGNTVIGLHIFIVGKSSETIRCLVTYCLWRIPFNNWTTLLTNQLTLAICYQPFNYPRQRRNQNIHNLIL